jgi:uncharacterized membrane protein YheB (UPF0754 family)
VDYTYFVTPIVGATIGYCTNWIAIKMLFKPYTEKRFLGLKVPFTPGLIPKERKRIAKAMGEVIENYLLTDEVIVNELTSEKIEQSIINFIDELTSDRNKKELASNLESYINIHVPINDLLGEDIVNQINQVVRYNEPKIKESIIRVINDNKFSSKVKQVIGEVIEKKFGALGSMFANTDAIYNQLAISVEEQLDKEDITKIIIDFINNNLDKQLVEVMPDNLREAIFEITIKKLASFLVEKPNENSKPVILEIYDKMVRQYFVKMIKDIGISKIIEKQINSFEINILEEMLLTIVNKELKAITMLGGLLGLIMSIIIILV